MHLKILYFFKEGEFWLRGFWSIGTRSLGTGVAVTINHLQSLLDKDSHNQQYDPIYCIILILRLLNLTYCSVNFIMLHSRYFYKKGNHQQQKITVKKRSDWPGGGHPPPSLTASICEKFKPFFPLSMIPWYPKQILLDCEEAEKCIFDVFLLPF